MKLFKGLFLSAVSISMLVGLSACGGKQQTQNTNKQSSTTQRQQISPSTKHTTDSGQKIKKSFIQSSSFPEKLPAKSTLYTLTLKNGAVSKNNIDRIGLFDANKGFDKPYKIIKGTKSGENIVLNGVPSASEEHLDIYELGNSSSFWGNQPLSIYTNSSLNQNNTVYFSRGVAMSGTYFVTDLNGNKLKQGKENQNITGYWYKLKTDVWYRLMSSYENKSALSCEFKISKNIQANNQSSMTSVSIPMVNGETTPAMDFKVPSGWKKQNLGGGSTIGYDWVNPKNKNQKIRFLLSGTVGVMKNKSGQWDVTGTIGKTGIKWTNISTDRLTANFTENIGNGKTGFGKAEIVKSLPVAVSLEVYGENNNFSQSILKTFQLNQ